MNSNTRLLRSRSDRMLAGVAAGIAHYLNTDPSIVRVIFVLLALSGPGIFIYPLLWVIMPEEALPTPGSPQTGDQVFVATGETQRLRIDPMTGAPIGPEQEIPINNVGTTSAPTGNGSLGSQVFGLILLGLGGFIALQMLCPGFASFLFPAALIAVGVWLLRRG